MVDVRPESTNGIRCWVRVGSGFSGRLRWNLSADKLALDAALPGDGWQANDLIGAELLRVCGQPCVEEHVNLIFDGVSD